MAPDPIRTPRDEYWLTLLGACFALALLVGDYLTAPPGRAWHSDIAIDMTWPGRDPTLWRLLTIPPAGYRLLLASAIILLPCVALWRFRRRTTPR